MKRDVGGQGAGAARSRAPSEWLLARWVFLRLLGAVFLVAFVSLAVQVAGLVGDDGILPVRDYLAGAHEAVGARAYRLLPTLLWLAPGDPLLLGLAWGGAGLSVLLIAGIAPVPVLFLLWLFYLSLSVGGQVFLGFQWDALLLETALLAIFFAPRGLLPRPSREARPSPVLRWCLWLLLFKLMFLSGVTKLASGDPTWRDWTALTYHYETQPLPAPTSWFMHQLPAWFQRLSVGFTFAVEIAAPLAIWVPERLRALRRVACGLMVGFQLLLIATGNYGFFNYLAIALCLLLLDDAVWRRVLPRTLVRRFDAAPHAEAPRGWRVARAVAAGVVLPLSLLAMLREVAVTASRGPGTPGLAWSEALLGWVAPLRSINGYGLFRVMTTERPEIAIEATVDGEHWRELPFRWKPGDPRRAPRFVAPHQPRLDWQMWFAALHPPGSRDWLFALAARLLEGSPPVRALLGEDPFRGERLRELRLLLYDYRFTTPAERAATGAWWVRERRLDLTGPIALRGEEPDAPRLPEGVE
jgi:hypothetical protein